MAEVYNSTPGKSPQVPCDESAPIIIKARVAEKRHKSAFTGMMLKTPDDTLNCGAGLLLTYISSCMLQDDFWEQLKQICLKVLLCQELILEIK